MFDVRSFRRADCDNDHYLVVARHRERLSVSKLTQKLDMQRFYLKKVNDAEVMEQYQVKISNRFTDSENLHVNVDINRAWENIRFSVKSNLGHYKLKQYKPWFDEECSKLLARWKQAKLRWFHNPRQMNEQCKT
jgi:ribosome biogenesis GTPase A